MKVAMFLKYEKMGVVDENIIRALIFELVNNIIVNIEQEYLSRKNINHISLWLVIKHIEEVYVNDADKNTKDYFNKIGVVIKTVDELESNNPFKVFL